MALKKTGTALAAFLAVALTGCAHTIKITPDVEQMSMENVPRVERPAGYFIAEADRKREVTSPGGGGDKVKYLPYRDLEPAFKQMLMTVFSKVDALTAAPSAEVAKASGVDFMFEPTFQTASSSSSILTWPPTDFTTIVGIRAYDASGKLIWEQSATGTGKAEFGEFVSNHGLAGQRASGDAFKKLQKTLAEAPEFRGK